MRRALLGAAIAALLAPGVAGAQVPLPKDDPFYAVPGGLDGVKSGTVLRSREVEASANGLPLDARAWQLAYRSLDAHDRPTAMVTTVLVPHAAWAGKGPRPLLSYQTPEDSSDTKCAISYALRAGLAAQQTQSNAASDTPMVGMALQRGWAVVTSDYQGPDSHFLAAPEEAHGVLDGIRAARAFAEAGVAPDAPIGLWGYSGGGYATSVAALARRAYAPELSFVGAAIGAPAVDVAAEIRAFDPVAAGAIAMGIAAIDRAYPEEHVLSYLNDAGRAAVAQSAHTCLAEAAGQHLGAHYADWEIRPGALEDPALAAFLRSNSPRHLPGHADIPVFHYHSATDEFAPLAPAQEMFARWCAEGTPTDTHIEAVGEHLTYHPQAAGLALDYLQARFAGVPAPNADGCPAAPASVEPAPAGPAARVTLRRHTLIVQVTGDGVREVALRLPRGLVLPRRLARARVQADGRARRGAARRLGARRLLVRAPAAARLRLVVPGVRGRPRGSFGIAVQAATGRSTVSAEAR